MVRNTLRKGRLNGKHRMRLIGLLDMEYKPAELAAEVGFSRKQIYRIYRKMPGFPCRVDGTKHLWINGADFRNWYHRTYPKIEIKSDEDQEEVTRAKDRFGKDHFENVNKRLRHINPIDLPEEFQDTTSQYYTFNLLRPETYALWFRNLRNGVIQ